MKVSKTPEQVVDEVLERWDMYVGLYPPWYVDRYFHLYDSEMRPLIKFLQEQAANKKEKSLSYSEMMEEQLEPRP